MFSVTSIYFGAFQIFYSIFITILVIKSNLHILFNYASDTLNRYFYDDYPIVLLNIVKLIILTYLTSLANFIKNLAMNMLSFIYLLLVHYVYFFIHGNGMQNKNWQSN